MEKSIRKLFSRKTAIHDENQLLQTQPYENTVALKAPVKGTNRVFGNGPNVLGTLQGARANRISPPCATPEPEAPAPAPSIPMVKRQSNSKRLRTAPHRVSGSIHVDEHTQGSLAFQNSSRKGSPEPQPPPLPPLSRRRMRRNSSMQPEYKFGGHDVASQHSKSGTSFVDILDAAAKINPSQSIEQRTQASGNRDYGEDVADRNIADPGGSVDLTSPQFDYLRALYALERVDGNKSKKGRISHKWDGSPWDHASDGADWCCNKSAQAESGESQSQSPNKARSIHSHTSSLRATAALPPPIAATRSRGSGDGPSHNIASQRPQSTKSPPPSISHQPPISWPSRRSSITSTKSCIQSRGGEDPFSLTEATPKPSVARSRALSLGSNYRSAREKQILNANTPVPPLPTFLRHSQVLPIPAFPIIDNPPVNDAGVDDLSRNPAIVGSERSGPIPRRRSRGFSASYYVFPSQSSKSSVASIGSTAQSEKGISKDAITPNGRKNSGNPILEAAGHLLPLQGKVGLANPEADPQINQIPPIATKNRDSNDKQVHEQGPPLEISNHVTASRSQSTVNPEGILTKENSRCSSLAKISVSVGPSRKSSLRPIRPSSSRDSIASFIDVPTSTSPQKTSSITSRIKRVFPSLENSANDTAQSSAPYIPFPHPVDDIDYDDDDDGEVTQYTFSAAPAVAIRKRSRVSSKSVDPNLFSPFLCPTNGGPSSSTDSSPRTPTAIGEERLLFNESGYGLSGMLPGLEEPTPISLTSAISSKYGAPIPSGNGPGTSKLSNSLLADIDARTARAAERGTKGRRERERERKANVSKEPRPLSAREGRVLKQ